MTENRQDEKANNISEAANNQRRNNGWHSWLQQVDNVNVIELEKNVYINPTRYLKHSTIT